MRIETKIITALTAVLLGAGVASAGPIPEKPKSVHLSARVFSATEVAYGLRNDNEEDVVVGIMSCSYSTNWSTDNSSVTIVSPISCDKNFCSTKRLKKKEMLSGMLTFALQPHTKVPLSFRLLFKGCTDSMGRGNVTETVKSNRTDLMK